MAKGFLKHTTGSLSKDTSFKGGNEISASKSGTGGSVTPFRAEAVTSNTISAAKQGNGGFSGGLPKVEMVTKNEYPAGKGK